MTTTAPRTAAPAQRRPHRLPLGVRLLRLLGWALITAGVVVLLYLVYSLLFTNLETDAAQAELLERWELEVGAVGAGGASLPDEPDARDDGDPAAPDVGSAAAVLEFVRPGSEERPVRGEPVFVVEGVTLDALRSGPGRYPGTARPGEDGNLAIAGHRTTYGAPFFNLDELQEGDEIHATGRDGVRHVYEVRELRVVQPTDTWVVGPDPLETGTPTLTLTTCHPRFSQAERLIAFAELVS